MEAELLDKKSIQMNVRIDRQLKEAGDAVLTHNWHDAVTSRSDTLGVSGR